MSHQAQQSRMLCSLDTESRTVLQEVLGLTELQQVEGDAVPGGSSSVEVQRPMVSGGQLAAARLPG